MGGSYYDEEYRDTHSEYELNRAAGFRSREWLPRGCDFDDAARRPEPALHARAGRRSSAVVVREDDGGRAYDDYEDYEDDPADEVRPPPRVVYVDEDTADSRVSSQPQVVYIDDPPPARAEPRRTVAVRVDGAVAADVRDGPRPRPRGGRVPASGAYPASPDIVRRVAAAAASPVSVEIEASLREIAGMVEDLERVAGEPLDGESPLRDATNVVEQTRERLLDQPPFASRPAAAPRRRSPSPTKLEKKLLWTSPSSSPTDERGRRDARNARRRAQNQSPYLDRLQRVSKKPDLVPVPSSNGDMVDTHLKSKSEVDGLRFKYEGTEFRESTVGKVKGGSRRGRRRGAANRDYDRILAAELANAVYRARDSAETPAGASRRRLALDGALMSRF
ncbi:hypothetical protein JL722_2 [Aureococcus anophagefferens]|nr:hypothetical protein JL722_2 [Aureococcus anophagefferens]